MKILVTGGAGFIGSHLVDRLVLEEHSVDVLDDFSTGRDENKNPKANYIVKDIRSDLGDLSGHDIVYHLAALARIQPSFDGPVKTIDINVRGTANLCHYALKNNAKFIYAGSSSIYAGQYLNPYAFSKWQGEEVCKMFSSVYGMSSCIARFFNVYGSRHLCKGPYATVVGIFERQILEGKPLTITGNGEQRRDFTHVNDILSGFILMSKKIWKGEVFNLGTGTNYSINELASIYGHKTEYIPQRPGEAEMTLADISVSEEKLEYSPSENLENYVKNWLKAHSLEIE